MNANEGVISNENMDSNPKAALQCPNCGANVDADCVQCAYCRSVLSITACPSCFGAVFKGMKFCTGCGAAVERSEVKTDRKLTCPRCAKRLVPADIAGTLIHECNTCGGIWLDPESFQRINTNKEQQEKLLAYHFPAEPTQLNTEARPDRYYIPCPACGELMNRKNFAGCSGTVIDICKQHGIWFDRQELQAILNFIKDGGLRKARENELDNLKAEQQRLKDLQYEQSLENMRMDQRQSFDFMADDGSLVEDIFSIIRKLF